ncbi:MAG: hypothetical protein XD82_0156 [Methanoculleus marisnigri]|uniref:Uncharacterized protein n=1 Tax=Methanoculleus marisnigri TaxID=2198 RepID=A0A101GSB8_9EURY|nr:MAG: hypothetical protein XD82_0156 [Methanoculleus marisnigri]
MSGDEKKLIRNSTVEFLLFTSAAGEGSIEVRYEDETIWLSQKMMAALFDVTVPTINVHLKNIYESGELTRDATIRKYLTVQIEGDREVSRTLDYYNLDAIISVGYRVNSRRATQFRQSTSLDYNRNAPTTREFFANVQNKLHFAIHGNTAAELIMARADSRKKHMGLSTWEKAPDGKILKTDVSVAKNYLNATELESLGRIVNAWLDLAEERARRKIPMTMEDWAKRLDRFLEFDERKLLEDRGKATKEMAKEFAESEFEKYRVVQDRLFESDFDRMLKEADPPEGEERDNKNNETTGDLK